MNTSDFAQRLADKLIAQLKEGTAPGKSRGSKVNLSARTTRRQGTDIEGLMFWRYSALISAIRAG